MPDYIWKLSDLKKVKLHGHNVFSCFSCGGGSTMGYKLAGFDVIGNVEIDSQMNKLYVANHKPRHNYQMDIRKFKQIPDDQLPSELFDLDILDGSPPCSSFSAAGQREKAWGIKKKFREGQEKQILDELFFDFLDVVEKLNPKIVIAENVKGLISGQAKGFVNLILKQFDQLGYRVQLFLLNAANMGVPQRRERVFFIAHRKELKLPKLEMRFNEKPIIYDKWKDTEFKPMNKQTKAYKRWLQRIPADSRMADTVKRTEQSDSLFNHVYWHNHRPIPTIVSGGEIYRYDSPGHPSNRDITIGQTFPIDYNFLGKNVQYVCGMSVPPIMMQKIAQQVYKQWLKDDDHGEKGAKN